jgi:predicted RNase H-like nuclease (RuvC/YqgF family)
MEISRSLNIKQNKKEIDRLERQLDKLKLIANETDEISALIKKLEGLIKNYYNKKKKQKRQKLDLVLNGRRKGKNQRDISLTLKKTWPGKIMV